jgi:serine/threonine protein kinase
VLGNISKGAYGHVYHVRKRDCNQEYAMKILSKSQVSYNAKIILIIKNNL